VKRVPPPSRYVLRVSISFKLTAHKVWSLISRSRLLNELVTQLVPHQPSLDLRYYPSVVRLPINHLYSQKRQKRLGDANQRPTRVLKFLSSVCKVLKLGYLTTFHAMHLIEDLKLSYTPGGWQLRLVRHILQTTASLVQGASSSRCWCSLEEKGS